MVDSVLVIGAGRFGGHLATRFYKMGKDVLIIDSVEERVNAILNDVPNAQIGDSTKEEVLRTIGVNNYDLCVVAIGNNFGASLETTLLLKELGAKYVIAKATRDIHAKFLLRSGADEVVYAEKQAADRVALRFSGEHIFDYIELNPELSIIEVPIHPKWIGKTIEEIDVRQKYNINILATKLDGKMDVLSGPNHVLQENEHLLIFGKTKDVMKFSDLV